MQSMGKVSMLKATFWVSKRTLASQTASTLATRADWGLHPAELSRMASKP